MVDIMYLYISYQTFVVEFTELLHVYFTWTLIWENHIHLGRLISVVKVLAHWAIAIATATSQQMGSGPIFATGDCDVVISISSFQLFCVQLLSFINNKISSGTSKNARKNHFSEKKENFIVIFVVAIASAH